MDRDRGPGFCRSLKPEVGSPETMHALIIEDDRAIADFVARGLREAGFAVDVATDGEEGLAAALEREPDVAIVDLMLPRREGLSVIDELRRRGRTTPVLILSARRSV